MGFLKTGQSSLSSVFNCIGVHGTTHPLLGACANLWQNSQVST